MAATVTENNKILIAFLDIYMLSVSLEILLNNIEYNLQYKNDKICIWYNVFFR